MRPSTALLRPTDLTVLAALCIQCLQEASLQCTQRPRQFLYDRSAFSYRLTARLTTFTGYDKCPPTWNKLTDNTADTIKQLQCVQTADGGMAEQTTSAARCSAWQSAHCRLCTECADADSDAQPQSSRPDPRQRYAEGGRVRLRTYILSRSAHSADWRGQLAPKIRGRGLMRIINSSRAGFKATQGGGPYSSHQRRTSSHQTVSIFYSAVTLLAMPSAVLATAIPSVCPYVCYTLVPYV